MKAPAYLLAFSLVLPLFGQPPITPFIIPDATGLDAFNRLRTSESVTLFDSQLQYNTAPLLWSQKTAGGGAVAHVPNSSAAALTVTTASGDSAIRQSKQYVRYQPGKSQQFATTFVLGAPKANMRQRVGLFDAQNGLYLEQAGVAAPAFVQRSFTSGSAVNTSVSQSSWNLDKLDGTGTSGLTLDLTKAQILVLDLQWLGVGRVRIGFAINGRFVYCHQFLNANVLTVPYMTTANLPARYEIENTGAAASGSTLTEICTMVASESGFESERAYAWAVNSTTTAVSVTTRRPILCIQPKSTFNSIVNRGSIVLQSIEVMTGTQDVLWEIVYNGTLTGAAFGSVNASSITDFDVSATAITGGLTVVNGYAPAGSGSNRFTSPGLNRSRLPLTLDIDGLNPDSFCLVVTRVGTTGTAGVLGAFNWTEVY